MGMTMIDHHVIIIGAGMGGLGFGMRMLKDGQDDFIIFERAADIGGTWRDNSYPGCGCDVPSHLYWYGFDDWQPDWTRRYPGQPEILTNIHLAAQRTGVINHVRLNTSVTGAEWDEDAQMWRVQTDDGQEHTARIMLAATGQLSNPTYRGIAGREDFAGDSWHSANWNFDVPMTGKRVGVIGSGSSAGQIIPAIAEEVGELVVFQRTAPWVIPRDDGVYTDEERAAFRNDPESFRASREAHFAELEQRFAVMTPASEGAAMAVALCNAMRDEQVPDPALRARLTPDYVLGCKRPVVSDDLLLTYAKPNVTLVDQGVDRIETAGVRTQDGALHPLDVIVYATGFASQEFLRGLNIRGRGGRTLHGDAWAEAPQAYLGMNVSGFPNLFILYGPNTNLNHNSIIAMFDAQYEYILGASDQIRAGVFLSADVRQDVMDRYNQELQRGLNNSSFTTGCNNWYRNANGRIVSNWWGTVVDYHNRVGQFRPEEFELIGQGVAA